MAELPGTAQNQCFQSPQEEEVEIEAKDSIWRSSHFPSQVVELDKLLKAQYLVQEQEDNFRLGQACAPCFLLKYKWAVFVFPGSCLLGSKERAAFFNHITIYFLNAVLLLTWPWWHKPMCSCTFSRLFLIGHQESAPNHSSSPGNSSHTAAAELNVQCLSFVNVKGIKHINVHPAEIIHPLNKCLLSVYCVPGPRLGIGIPWQQQQQ